MWEVVANLHNLNSTFPRTADACEKKHHNIVQTATAKWTAYKKNQNLTGEYLRLFLCNIFFNFEKIVGIKRCDTNYPVDSFRRLNGDFIYHS